MPYALRWSWGGDASPGSGCKHRLSLAERPDCPETIINQLLANSYQNPISEWQVAIKLHLAAGFKSESSIYFSPRVAHPLFYLTLPSTPLSLTGHLSQSQFWYNNNRNKVHNKCNALESSPDHPPTLIRGKIVFHGTGPWCQKGWGPLP